MRYQLQLQTVKHPVWVSREPTRKGHSNAESTGIIRFCKSFTAIARTLTNWEKDERSEKLLKERSAGRDEFHARDFGHNPTNSNHLTASTFELRRFIMRALGGSMDARNKSLRRSAPHAMLVEAAGRLARAIKPRDHTAFEIEHLAFGIDP